jgi:hypothetical protein
LRTALYRYLDDDDTRCIALQNVSEQACNFFL